MADENQRLSTFEIILEPINDFAAGRRISAGKFNVMLRNQRKIGGVQPAVQVGPSGRSAGQIDFGIVRGWTNPTDDFMDMSLISRDSETGTWFIPEEATVEVVCSPGLQASDYETVQWIGESGENYPLTLPSQITVLAQPIVSVGTDLVAMWLPSLVPAQDIPANLPVTDGYNVNGAGEVGFDITP